MRNYLVVGGSSGIGLALSKELLAEGHQIRVASRTSGDLPINPHVQHIPYDVRDKDASLDIDWDTLHGIAYCPGSINLKPFHRLKREDFLEDLEINFLGAVKVIQACLPILKQAEKSSIVLFSTVAVSQGMNFHSSIASAKGAIEGLGRSLAAELAPKVRVNVIAPSLVDTPLASRLLSNDAKREAAAKRHPLQRSGEVEDIAAMGAFLLSNKSGWMTGQVLGIDGGLSTLRTM